MKKTLAVCLSLILTIMVNCAAPAPDASDIRPLVKEFLVALSRHDTASALLRSTDGFIAGVGGEPALIALMDRYASYLVPNLFEFESPQPDGDAYLIRAYLHDGRRSVLPLDIWVVAGDSGWKVDRIVWHEPVKER
jgi:hypothetical protein